MLDMRHTLPNLKNLILTLTSSLGDEERGPTTQGDVHENTDGKNTIAEDDTGTRTPLRDNPPRKTFFAPISEFWLARSGSNTAKTPNGSPVPPLHPFTPETGPSEDPEAAAAALTSPHEAPVEHSPALEDTNTLKLPNGNNTLKSNGLSVGSDTAISEQSATETVGTRADDGDTETIKDGTAGRAAAQSSWITKAFFGQIDRDRDRDKGPHSASVYRKRSTAAITLTAAAAGAGL